MEGNKTNNKQVDEKDKGKEPKGERKDDCGVCRYCDVDPCWGKEMEPVMISLLKIYGGRLENRKLRFKMYCDAVKHIHGPGLGKGVRKQLPECVTSLIRGFAPDKKYTGFVETGS